MDEINSCACGRRCFTLHFNRDKAEETGQLEWLIHYDGKSESVTNFKCSVAIDGKFKETTPKAVIHGVFNEIKVENGVAYID